VTRSDTPDPDETVDGEWYEQDNESNLPWLDEAEIVTREYSEDDPWINEG
jgi:hypothetical protein